MLKANQSSLTYNDKYAKLTISPVFILHVQLAKTKITQSDVSSVIKQDVLRLEVAVDDVETM